MGKLGENMSDNKQEMNVCSESVDNVELNSEPNTIIGDEFSDEMSSIPDMSGDDGDNSGKKSAFKKLARYWKAPAPGRYMPFKEIAAYGVGGMGIHFMISFLNCAFAPLILMIMYGLTPMHATTITVIVAVINLVIMPFLYRKFDTVDTKRGKFRTFIGILAPLLAGLIVLSSFAPQLGATGKMIYAYFTVIPTLILSGLLTNIYNMMPTTLTPNSQERADMLSPASLIFSIAPTVVNFVFMPIRGIFQKLGKEYLAFRYMGIVFAILGCAIAFILVKWTKEKVFVVAKKADKIDTKQALKDLFKNKAFILLTIFNILGPLKVMFDANIAILFDYRFSAEIGDGNIWSALINLTAPLATVSMLAIPFILRKLKKRDLLIGINVVNGLMMLILGIVGFENIPIGVPTMALTFFIKAISMFNVGMTVIIIPTITCELYDQQQLITGKRLEGFMSTVTGYIGIVGIILAFVPALIQEQLGFLPGENIFRPGNELYDPNFAIPIATNWLNVTAWISAGTTLVSIIPLFFYKLTEKRHKEIIEELKEKATQYQLETGEVNGDAINVLHEVQYDDEGNVIDKIDCTEELLESIDISLVDDDDNKDDSTV